VSDEGQEAQVEPRQDSDRLEEVRAWGERNEKRAKDLEDRLGKMTAAMRRQAITQAGMTQDYLIEGALALAERDHIDDPNDLANLARVMLAQARGEME
jgi:hypothetical protein